MQQGADYILAVKDNQKHLHDDVKEGFEQNKISDMAEDLQKNHGRIEKRICRIIRDTDSVYSKNDWTNLKPLIEITATRTLTATGITETHTRQYISSLAGTADYFSKAIRKHWGIENNLHWVLDVCFGEDKKHKKGWGSRN